MAQEHDAKEVVDLALQQISNFPNVRYSWDVSNHLTLHSANAITLHAVATDLCLSNLLHRATFVSLRILKDVDTSESLFWTEVLADNSDKIVKALLVLQVLHLRGELVKIE